MPDDGDHSETDTEAGLVRAADLIGQLGDPLYPRKLNALFYEFAETGVNQTQLSHQTKKYDSISKRCGARSDLGTTRAKVVGSSD